MKCVILCAGRGSRMGSLTKSTPKCLLNYQGKTLLDHKLEILPKDINEIILIVGYLGELVVEHINKNAHKYKNRKIDFVYMSELNGTGGAVQLVRHLIVGEELFLVLMGDDIYGEQDLEEIIQFKEPVIGVFKNPIIESRALFFDDQDFLYSFDSDSNLENTGMYLLDLGFFSLDGVSIKNNQEISLPHTLVNSANRYKIKKFLLRSWKKFNHPDDFRI